MNDRILSAYLKAFIEDYGLNPDDEGSAFESFVNHLVVSRVFPGQFEPEDVGTGGSGDLGIDGIAIVVNDNLAHSIDDVEYFRKQLRRLDVQFHFIQAKTSAHFEAAAIGSFVSGVRMFFQESLPDEANGLLRDAHTVKEYIYDQSVHMDGPPTCSLHYATAGSWLGTQALVTRIEQGEQDLRGSGLFSSVQFTPWDAEGLKSLHQRLHGRVVREIVFDKHTIVPSINAVEEAYIGIIPCSEYLKLLVTDDGDLDRRLFYDNVRDFQGHNSVNQEIARSITDDADRADRFVLLNNGVTIVASSVNKVGARFKLSDYQIVNGCQTSHIIYHNRDDLSPHTHLPVKLIVTTDVEVMNDITRATNRQTEVKKEAFESLTPFQKELEELYLALGREMAEPLYYERRSKQYEHTEARRDRVVSLPAQLKCFLAMFLNEPHSVHRYYGELLEAYRPRVFAAPHSTMPYFTSGLALSNLERWLATTSSARHLRRYKHHLLMVFRMQTAPHEVPPLNSHKKLDAYCQPIVSLLGDTSRASDAFYSASQVLEAALTEIGSGQEDPARRRSFTEALIDHVGMGAALVADLDRVFGVVAGFSDTKGFGFVDGDDGDRYFAHYSDVRGEGYRSLANGERVSFVPVADSPRSRATDVVSEGP